MDNRKWLGKNNRSTVLALMAAGAAWAPLLSKGDLAHRWSFNDGTANDSVGTANGTLHGGAAITDGHLVLNGTDPTTRMETEAFGHTLGTDKTLVTWCTLNDPSDGATSGGPLSVENQNGYLTVFDAIAYGERTSRQWMNGSDMWYRTPASNGGALETAASTNELMLAIVYDSAAGNKVTLYRNGVLYGQHNQGTLATYNAAAVAVIGPRVSWADGQCSGYLNGKVNEARVYTAALTAAEVASLAAEGPDTVLSPANGDFETGVVGQAAPKWTLIAGFAYSTASVLVDADNAYYPDPPQGGKMVNMEINFQDRSPVNYPILESDALGLMALGEAYTFSATAVSTAESMSSHCSAYRFSLWDATVGEEVGYISGDITTSNTTRFVTFTTPATDASRVGHILKVRLAADGHGYAPTQYHIRLAVDNVTVARVNALTTGAGIWTNPAGGSWLTDSNWSGNTLANGADAIANFSTLGLTADATVTLDAPRSVGHLVFGDADTAHNWAVTAAAGGPLMLDVSSGTPSVTVSNQSATLALTLAGSKGLIKDGAGLLTLTDAAGYKGAISVNKGTLQLGDKLAHRWSFNDGTARDSAGGAHGVLYGTASVANGQLVLNGTAPVTRMETAAFGHTLGADKTLVAWFTLNNPSDGNAAGGPLSVANQNGNSTVFDAITYGERMARQWMNGSDNWLRTPPDNGGVLETAGSTNELMMVIVYDASARYKITLYRNGVLHAQYNRGALVTYDAAAVAVIGPRVSWKDGQCWGYLNGKVNEARVYRTALSAQEVAALYAAGPDDGSAVSQTLPSDAPVAVAAGATLDLNGGSQTVGTLSGSGSVSNGAITVTGALAPGDVGQAPGTLAIQANLTLADSATLNYDYTSATADSVAVAGTVTIQGTNVVTLAAVGGATPPSRVTLFTFHALAGGDNLSGWTVQTSGLHAYEITLNKDVASIYVRIRRIGTLISVR